MDFIDIYGTYMVFRDIAVNPDIQLYLIVVSSIFIGLCGSLSL